MKRLEVEEYVKYAIENLDYKEVDNILPWSSYLPKEVKISKGLN